jgi:hypothetical protein
MSTYDRLMRLECFYYNRWKLTFSSVARKRAAHYCKLVERAGEST